MTKPTHVRHKKSKGVFKINKTDLGYLYINGSPKNTWAASPDYVMWDSRFRFICPSNPKCIKQAPYPDADGNKLHYGDVVVDKNGAKAVVNDSFGWLVKYGNGFLRSLEFYRHKISLYSSRIKYTESQRAAGMHLFKEDIKPFSGRTQRRG